MRLEVKTNYYSATVKASCITRTFHCHPGRKLKLSLPQAVDSSTGKWERQWPSEGIKGLLRELNDTMSTQSPACSRCTINGSSYHCVLPWQVMHISHLYTIVPVPVTGHRKQPTQFSFAEQGRWTMTSTRLPLAVVPGAVALFLIKARWAPEDKLSFTFGED